MARIIQFRGAEIPKEEINILNFFFFLLSKFHHVLGLMSNLILDYQQDIS